MRALIESMDSSAKARILSGDFTVGRTKPIFLNSSGKPHGGNGKATRQFTIRASRACSVARPTTAPRSFHQRWCPAWAMKQLGGRISGSILKAARKFWDRTRLREWMGRLILTPAWNQESLKEGLLNSSFFLYARITNECCRTQGRLTALSINQCPMVRFSRRTTRLPRYFAMSIADISCRLA